MYRPWSSAGLDLAAAATLAGSFALIGTSPGALGNTLSVPTDFPTIQQAIDASSVGDTVLVLPNTYVENLVINANIVVRSADGPATTIIDGSAPSHPDSASVVRISEGTIEGFDIRNGTGTLIGNSVRRGGGIRVEPSEAPGPLIRNNWIHGNSLTGDQGVGAMGGGIEGETAARVASNRIYANTVQSDSDPLGAAVLLGGFADVLLQDNEIFDNHVLPPIGPFTGGAVHTGEAIVVGNVIACNGGGLAAGLFGQGQIENNTVVTNWSNAVPPEGAVRLRHAEDLVVVFRSNTITHNLGPGLDCNQRALPPFTTFIIECNNIWGNFPGGQVIGDCGEVIGQDGNISVDPNFAEVGCPWVLGSGCLNEGSPLLPENSPPGCGLIGALGVCEPIGVEEPEPSSPSRFQALPARPNPFAERTTIPFFLAHATEVQVWIYNVLGRRLRTLSPGWLFAGEHTLEWDGRHDDGARAASGAYVARIRAGGQELTRTLLLVR